MRNGFKVIDADAHFYEPGDIWDSYVEASYQDRRPRVTQVHGKAILEYEGEETMNALRSKTLFSQMDAKFAMPSATAGAWRAGLRTWTPRDGTFRCAYPPTAPPPLPTRSRISPRPLPRIQ